MVVEVATNQCWISNLSFCSLKDVGSGLDGGSSSHGFALTTPNGQLWPMPEGEPERNLGCVLVIDTGQTLVDLGVHVVAYGLAPARLSFSLFELSEEAQTPTSVLVYTYTTRINLGAPMHCSGPGPNWKRVRLHQCPIHAQTRYNLRASVGSSGFMDIPLYVHERTQWRKMEQNRIKSAMATLEGRVD